MKSINCLLTWNNYTVIVEIVLLCTYYYVHLLAIYNGYFKVMFLWSLTSKHMGLCDEQG